MLHYFTLFGLLVHASHSISKVFLFALPAERFRAFVTISSLYTVKEQDSLDTELLEHFARVPSSNRLLILFVCTGLR